MMLKSMRRVTDTGVGASGCDSVALFINTRAFGQRNIPTHRVARRLNTTIGIRPPRALWFGRLYGLGASPYL